MTILITVDCIEGEESISRNEIEVNELNYLNPLLLEIRNNNGYWVSGKFLNYPDPPPEICYRNFNGVNLLKSYLPTPINGIKRILEISIFQESPITLYL